MDLQPMLLRDRSANVAEELGRIIPKTPIHFLRHNQTRLSV
jgi:hypothetical protein